MSGIKLTPTDIAISLCVRERAGGCEICGNPNTQCCHFEGRGNWATRFEPLNLFAFCYGHHCLMDGRKLTFEKWIEKHRSKKTLSYIWSLARDADLGQKIRDTKGKGEIAEYFQNQYKIMLEKRASGVLGWLDFEPYKP
jgi:hypothetical protein